jgi:intracellular multiplication protein IcmQ
MKDDLTIQEAKEVLDALDDAINKGPWDKSTFLKAIGKKLQEIRYDFALKMNDGHSNKNLTDAHLAKRIALRAGQLEVFVSLFCAEGQTLRNWEKIVNNLTHQVISRPVYAKEEEVKSLLRTKENINREAYVGVYIDKHELLHPPPDRIPKDKLGNDILTFKDNAFNVNNITYFYHASGIYTYEDGRLIRQSDMNLSSM